MVRPAASGARSLLLPGRQGLRRARLTALLSQDRLAAQTDPIAVHFDDLDEDLLALLDLVGHLLHAMLGNLRDVQQPFDSGQDLHERAERDDADDLAEIGLADFGL